MTFAGVVPHQGEALGRPSRNAAKAALEAHLEVLKGEPLRRSLSEALRAQKALGGQERRFAALATRELSRHQRLLDHAAKLLGEAPSKWVLKEDQVLIRYALWRRIFTGAPAERVMAEVKLPGPLRPRSVKDSVLEDVAGKPLPEPEWPEDPVERAAMRHSFPNWLAKAIAETAPKGEIDAVLAALNEEPSLYFRVRPPGMREDVMRALEGEGVRSEPIEHVADALRISDAGNRVFETKAMKAGRLQSQDVGSQLIVELCAPKPSQQVADICAGAGGKSLALADRVAPSGRVFASDLSRKRLQDARERASELRIKNISFPNPVAIAEMDVVLIDAPCSGVGSLGREPDQKWKLTAKAVSEFQKTQRQLLEDTAGEVKEGGVIVYATCSLLRAEDEDVVEGFLAAHPEFELEDASEYLPKAACEGRYLRAWPNRVPGGGFFGARLRKSGR